MNVVYQGTFQNGPWGGRADFLVRVERPGLLGPFSYEVLETKLARSAKVREAECQKHRSRQLGFQAENRRPI